MARGWVTDYLQSHTFWLCDIAPLDLLSLPIFNPLMGFKSISGPEINFDTEEIREANWPFTKKVIKGGSCSAITLTRGSTWYDSDFWRWTMAALRGDPEEFNGGIVPLLRVGGPTPRRTMMLVHFFNRSVDWPFNDRGGNQIRAGLTGAGLSLGGQGGLGAVSALQTGLLGEAAAGLGLGAFDFTPRIPAKVYLLYGCLPSRYKLAGDFDASSAEVSMAELEMSVEMVEHCSFGF